MTPRRYYLAAAALVGLFVVACSIERADARPLPLAILTIAALAIVAGVLLVTRRRAT